MSILGKADLDAIDINLKLGDFADSVVSRLMSTSSYKIASYSGSGSEFDVEKWLSELEFIAKAMKWDDLMKNNRLPVYLTDAAGDWFEVFVKGKEDTMSWDNLKKLMLSYFTPTSQTSYVREQLRHRKQLILEPVSDYVVAVLRLCKRVNNAMGDEEKIEHIIAGLLIQMKRKVKMFAFNKVDELINVCKKVEESLKTVDTDMYDRENEIIISYVNTERQNGNEILTAINSLSESLKIFAANNQKQNQFWPNSPPFNRRSVSVAERPSQNLNVSPQCARCNRYGHTEYSCRSVYNNRFN